MLFPWCIVMPSIPRIRDTQTHAYPHDVKEAMIHQTRQTSFFAPRSSFDAHMQTEGTSGGQHGHFSVATQHSVS